MKLTTRGRYAIQALLDLIANSTGKAVKLEDISARQNLSIAYLEQLFRQMRIGGIVKSVRGPGGGYVLMKAPTEILIRDVLTSVKEITSYSDVVKIGDASTREAIGAHKISTRLDEVVLRVISQPLSSLL